jgi:hypothetical protein
VTVDQRCFEVDGTALSAEHKMPAELWFLWELHLQYKFKTLEIENNSCLSFQVMLDDLIEKKGLILETASR